MRHRYSHRNHIFFFVSLKNKTYKKKKKNSNNKTLQFLYLKLLNCHLPDSSK